MKKFFSVTLVIILVFGMFLLLKTKRDQNANFILYEKVVTAVNTEIDKVKPDNIIYEDKNKSDSGCYFDHKVRTLRCGYRITKYYGSNTLPTQEYWRLNDNLLDLGWSYWAGEKTEEDIETYYEKVGGPYQIYNKNPYNLELMFRMYDDREKGCKYTCNKKVVELLEDYSSEYKYIYSLSISSDIINQ